MPDIFERDTAIGNIQVVAAMDIPVFDKIVPSLREMDLVTPSGKVICNKPRVK